MIHTQMSYYYLCAKHYKTEQYHCNKSSKEFRPFENQGDYKDFTLICLPKTTAEKSVGIFSLHTLEEKVLSQQLKTSNYILHNKDTHPTHYSNQPLRVPKF
jgi:hypothetical protein